MAYFCENYKNRPAGWEVGLLFVPKNLIQLWKFGLDTCLYALTLSYDSLNIIEVNK